MACNKFAKASENHDLARKLNPCQKWILGGLAVFCMDCHADKSARNDRQGALCEKVDSRGFGVLCLSTLSRYLTAINVAKLTHLNSTSTLANPASFSKARFSSKLYGTSTFSRASLLAAISLLV